MPAKPTMHQVIGYGAHTGKPPDQTKTHPKVESAGENKQ